MSERRTGALPIGAWWPGQQAGAGLQRARSGADSLRYSLARSSVARDNTAGDAAARELRWWPRIAVCRGCDRMVCIDEELRALHQERCVQKTGALLRPAPHPSAAVLAQATCCRGRPRSPRSSTTAPPPLASSLRCIARPPARTCGTQPRSKSTSMERPSRPSPSRCWSWPISATLRTARRTKVRGAPLFLGTRRPTAACTALSAFRSRSRFARRLPRRLPPAGHFGSSSAAWKATRSPSGT